MPGDARRRVYLNKPELWSADGRPVLVEPLIEGTYAKFNSNSGWVNEGYNMMQALSHFSYHVTEGRYLLCDLQGGGGWAQSLGVPAAHFVQVNFLLLAFRFGAHYWQTALAPTPKPQTYTSNLESPQILPFGFLGGSLGKHCKPGQPLW